MYNFTNNNIKEYAKFDMASSSQKIGIFVVKNNNEYQSPTYIRLLSTFNNLPSKFESCLIDVKDENVIELVRSDLLNDNFLLDIVILSRDAFYSNDFVELLLKKCKLFGIKIIYELDDDLMNIDKSHRDYNYYVKKRSGIFLIAENADIITVSTNALKSKLSNYNDDIIVIPNVVTHYWDVPVDKIRFHDKNIVKIGYMGTPTHRDDIKLLEEAIVKVNDYFKDSDFQIAFEMIGGTADKLSWANQINISARNKTFPNFVKFLKKIVDWDIAVAPLEDNNINKSKSELKYIEYTRLGIPGIYSDIGPYKENIIHEYNGLLVKSNTPDEWASNIIRIIEDSDLRKNIIDVAKKDIEVNYNLDISINMWIKILEKCSRDKDSILYKKFKSYIENKCEKSFLDYLINESHAIIEQSGFFDENYYLSNNLYNTENFNIDSIYHYLKLGCVEGCDPCPFFNQQEYLNKYFYIYLMKINPFVHYILYNSISNKPLILFDDTIYSSDYEDNYKILNNSILFDRDYYLKKYSDVSKSMMDPLEHWIKFGFRSKEYFRNPNNYFSKSYYIGKYLINGQGFWNSLTHYEFLGKKRGFKQNIFDIVHRNCSNNQIDEIIEALSEKIFIIVPIFNLFPEIEHYFKNLICNTPQNVEFMFIIENSINLDLNKIFEGHDIKYNQVYFKDYVGFFDLIQTIVSNLNNDFVLLNSYTLVTKGWLKKLVIKAYSDEHIDMVSPISNLFGDMSLEFINDSIESNILSIEEINTLIQKSNDGTNLQLDYFDGSCIFIKKRVIIDFDFNKVSIVYNNEMEHFGLDFHLSNKNHCLDDSTYVYLNEDFFRNNQKHFNMHVPKFSILSLKINQFLYSFEVTNIKKNIKQAIKYMSIDTLQNRVLYVIKEENKTLFDNYLMMNNYNVQDIFILTFNHNTLKLWKNNFLVKNWIIPKDMEKLKYIYFNLYISLNLDLVHFLDVSDVIFNLVDIANILNIDISITCSDYHMICPFLINHDYCCGECDNLFSCPHDFLIEYKSSWIKNIINLFNNADEIIIKEDIYDSYNIAFPILREKNITYVYETFWRNGR